MGRGMFATKGLAVVFSIPLVHCTIMPRPLALPNDGEATVAVLSEALPHSMSGLARHSWIAARGKGARSFRRFEVLGSATIGEGDPFEPQCHCGRDSPEEADVRMHALVRGHDAETIIPCLERETKRYNKENEYGFWPGPNCNTYVATMARACGISVELPSTANGRDYRGLVGGGVTSGGTGVQFETPLVGLKLGLKEGIEIHLFGAAVGIDFWPPAIIVPIGPGRIGFDDR